MEGFLAVTSSGTEQPHHISSPACNVAIISRISRQRNKVHGRKESGAELGLFQKEAAGLRVLWAQQRLVSWGHQLVLPPGFLFYKHTHSLGACNTVRGESPTGIRVV